MNEATTDYGLMAAWTGAADTVMAMATCSMALMTTSADAAMSIWQAPTEPALRPVEIKRSNDWLPRGPLQSEGDTVRRPQSTGRSWYRSPYRTPFDPMFWLDQGSLADPGMGGFGGSAALPGWGAMMPLAAMPATGLGAAGIQPTAVDMLINPWRPFGALWAGPAADMLQPIGAGARGELGLVPEFPGLSTYRSASGHAVAQISIDAAAACAKALPLALAGATPFDRRAMQDWQTAMAFGWFKYWMPR